MRESLHCFGFSCTLRSKAVVNSYSNELLGTRERLRRAQLSYVLGEQMK